MTMHGLLVYSFLLTAGYGGRWNFVQGESGLQGSKVSARAANSSKLYRRKLQKRLMHHKQQLLDLQQAKKHFLSSQVKFFVPYQVLNVNSSC
jgi:Leu/Phe-tRNA-protein transferase